MRILRDILDTNWNVMYYSNESVIKALVSLKMKAYFLSLKGEHIDYY